MAYNKIPISVLPECSTTDGLQTLGIDAQGQSVRIPFGAILAGKATKTDINFVKDLGDFETEADGDAATLDTSLNTNTRQRLFLYRFKGPTPSGVQIYHSRVILNSYNAGTNSSGTTARFDITQFKFAHDGTVMTRTITGVNWSAESRGGSTQWRRITLNSSDLSAVGGYSVVGGVMHMGHFNNLDAALTVAARSDISGARGVNILRFTYQGAAGVVSAFIHQTIKGDDVAVQYIFDRGTVKVRCVTGASPNNTNGTAVVDDETTWAHRIAWNGNDILLTGYEPYGGSAPVLSTITGVAKTSQLPTPQSKRTATAEDKMFVYCVDNPQSKQSVLNAPDTLLRQTGGKLKLQKGIWNPNGASVYYTANEVPCATTGADGAMAKEVFNRLGGAGDDAPRIYVSSTATTEVTITYPNWALGGTRTFTIGQATSARAGVMSKDDKLKLDALMPIIYGRSDNTKRAINSALFALGANATDAEIKAALTEYATKAVLTRQELEQCAASGCTLWDEQTQAQVHVTHNGGGFFNFVELSQVHYGELPHLRFVGLRAMEDGTYKVTRPGMTERIAFQSELQTLIERIEALESTINTQE